jgi:putative nucleotidyltransferase with HDIG domain
MTRKLFRKQPRGTQVYILLIVVSGAAIVCQSTWDLATADIGWNWLTLALLTLLSGSATVSLPSLPATVSVSETFVFTSVILFGPSAGTLTVALDAAVISFWSYRRGQAAYKILFNVCALPLTIWLASHLFFFLLGVNSGGRALASQPLFRNPDPVTIRELLGPLFVFTIVYFGLNSWIIAFAIALERRLPTIRIWREHFARLSLNYFGGASIAALFVTYTKDLDYSYLAIIIPLLVVLYFTFSTSVGRVDDANRHLTELNALYMSTIETLAMAIDAKDQITHGHIRRVQRFALGLARQLGVKDPSLISAIEAAALLHDMGKLAVPEYILNKPGPLTAAEFDKMKLHASVGADILSAVNFPYPVVPIVRHHHENWNGTGYPDGISGTDIPIGARILSVVDCFDALTSDRPYRPRLTDREAIDILLTRRGTMYDPLIVDTFVREHARISSGIEQPVDRLADALSAGTWPTTSSPDSEVSRGGFEDIAASTGEMLVLYDIALALSGATGLENATEAVAGHLRRLMPVSVLILYGYSVEGDELIAKYGSGAGAHHFRGIKIPRGQRLSGWVAANKRTIANSDAVLDLGDTARSIRPRLRSCLSTPLIADTRLVGVLTAYSTEENAFSTEHARLLEVVARQISHGVAQLLDREYVQVVEALKLSADADVTGSLSSNTIEGAGEASFTIIAVQMATGGEGRDEPLNDSLWSSITAQIRESLRPGDVVFRYGAGRLVAFLPNASSSIASRVAQQVHERLETAFLAHGLRPDLMVMGVATAPSDGLTLDALIDAAARRTGSPKTSLPARRAPFIH